VGTNVGHLFSIDKGIKKATQVRNMNLRPHVVTSSK
jgi:hypothetical protein